MSIEVIEFLNFIDVDRTPFALKAFSIMDFDGSGALTFFEFSISVWNYCTLTKETLGQFAFDLYDTDGSGHMSLQEAEGMIKSIYGKLWQSSENAKYILKDMFDQVGVDEEVELTIWEFLQFTKKHQTLLFPAFKLQAALRKNVLGTDFWEKATRVRREKNKNLDHQRHIVNLLRSMHQGRAVRFVCRELWGQDRSNYSHNISGGDIDKKSKKKRRAFDTEPVARCKAEIETIHKKAEKKAEKKLLPEGMTADQKREKELFAQFDGNLPRDARDLLGESGDKIRSENPASVPNAQDKKKKKHIPTVHMKSSLAKRLAAEEAGTEDQNTDKDKDPLEAPKTALAYQRVDTKDLLYDDDIEDDWGDDGDDDAAPLREDLIRQSVIFLNSKECRTKDTCDLLFFLDERGLSPEEVIEALSRVDRWLE